MIFVCVVLIPSRLSSQAMMCPIWFDAVQFQIANRAVGHYTYVGVWSDSFAMWDARWQKGIARALTVPNLKVELRIDDID